tara:strand:+ start:9521 stop:9730 length:210 start_codon:yes stop_codon:yes gene_type:complete
MKDVYEYQEEISYKANFNSWLSMNTRERINAKEKPLDLVVAKRMFNETYGGKRITDNFMDKFKWRKKDG